VSLAPGARIGVYEVVAKLGAGGMGVVYRARDAKLARDVALKILPAEFANNPERLARFEREAKTLASLNHPHIAHVYGFEQSGDTAALVMELVEGEELAERIRRGPIPLDEALPIARQIAEALEAAHEAGIIHRDLKPANVKVRRDGTVKVLDFGLAKALDQGSGIVDQGSVMDSPTITSPAMTMRGVILGTAAYMAPEQAKGKFVDKRADIWAFGCVLFEMLTGRRAFEGEDVSETLASVLRADPDWRALSARATPAITHLVRHCLVRDPRQRVRDIGDIRIQLEEALSPIAIESASPPPSRSRWIALALAGAAAAIVLAVGVPFALTSMSSAPADGQVLRFAVPVPEGFRLHRGNAGRVSIALSPDGQKLAAVLRSTGTSRRVFVKRLDDTEFRVLAGTDGANSVFWAPDSEQFGIATPTGMRFTSLSGASSLPSVTLPGYGPAAWGDDRIVAWAGTRPLHRWTVGGQAVADAALPKDVVSRAPSEWLPDGAGLLLLQTVNRGGSASNEVAVAIETPDGHVHEFARLDVQAGSSATPLVRSGYLLLARVERSGRSVLTAQRFDPATRTLSQEQAALATDLNQAISASHTGVLAFAQVGEAADELAWVDGRGRLLSRVMAQTPAENFDLSLDDRFIVLQEQSALRLHDLQRGVTSALTGGADPLWSADGRHIAYVVTSEPDRGIFVIPAFGGAPRKVYTAAVPTYIDGWSRDGNWLAAHTNRINDADLKGDGILIPLAPGAKPIAFGDTTGERAVDEARFSPDGRWLAFGLNSLDSGDVFLMSLPPTGERWQVSVSGGGQPRWSSDGRSLYFLATDGTLMMVDIDAKRGAPPTISAPRPLFQTGISVSLGVDQYAVSRDGKRFLLRRPQEQASTREEIQIIVNWPALLNKPQE